MAVFQPGVCVGMRIIIPIMCVYPIKSFQLFNKLIHEKYNKQQRATHHLQYKQNIFKHRDIVERFFINAWTLLKFTG